MRQIAEVVGVSEKVIRKQRRRLGWPAAKVVQVELPLPAPAADSNLSGSVAPTDEPVQDAALARRRHWLPLVLPVRGGATVLADALRSR